MSTQTPDAIHPRVAHLHSILQPIDRAPTLFRFNGIGPTLLGQLRYPYAEPYYIAMQFFTFAFIPLFPLGFYLVKPGGGNSYYFVGRLRHADLREFAGPEGMRALWMSLLRHPSVWLGLAVLGVLLYGVVMG